MTWYSPLNPLDIERESDEQQQYELCANVSKTKPKINKRKTGHKGSMHQLLSYSKTEKKPPIQPSTKQNQQKYQPWNLQLNIHS